MSKSELDGPYIGDQRVADIVNTGRAEFELKEGHFYVFELTHDGHLLDSYRGTPKLEEARRRAVELCSADRFNDREVLVMQFVEVVPSYDDQRKKAEQTEESG